MKRMKVNAMTEKLISWDAVTCPLLELWGAVAIED